MESAAPKPSTICFFSHSAHFGGGELSLLELVGELVKDHAVRCHVVLPGPGPLQARLEAAGASTEILGFNWWCHPGEVGEEQAQQGHQASAENVLLAAATTLGALAPDLVCTNTLVSPWGAVAAALLGKPHIWYVRELGVADHRFHQPFAQTLQWIADSSTRVITNSRAVREGLFAAAAPEKCLTVYNYIESPSPERGTVEYFRRAGAFRLIMLGTFCEVKGQRDAVLAVDELVGAGVPVELLLGGITGTPEYKAALEDLIRERNLSQHIRIVDFIANPYPALAQADALLVCTRQEAFGRVALEAMLLGKPVIGTRSGGLPELVQDGATGLLYEPGDVRGLAEKIRSLATDRPLAARLGAEGRACAQRKFTREQYGDRVLAIAKEAISEWERRPARDWDSYWRASTLGAFERMHRRWQEQRAELAAANAKLVSSMEDQARAIRDQQQAAEALAQRLADQGRELADRCAAVARGDQELEQWKRTAAQKDEEIARRTQEAGERRGAASAKDEEIARRIQEAEQLRAAVALKEQEIARRAQETEQWQCTAALQGEELARRAKETEQLRSAAALKDQEIARRLQEAEQLRGAAALKDQEIARRLQEAEQLRSAAALKDQEIARESQEIARRDHIIREIASSRAWKTVQFYARLRDQIFPVGSQRRRVLRPAAKALLDLGERLLTSTRAPRETAEVAQQLDERMPDAESRERDEPSRQEYKPGGDRARKPVAGSDPTTGAA